MIVHASLEQIKGTDRDVGGDGWRSRRLALAADGLPFSVHDTVVAAGTELRLCYSNHSETVYCLEGKAQLLDVARNETITVEPGVFYSVGIGDEHVLTISEQCRFLCIFDPPLEGIEEAS